MTRRENPLLQHLTWIILRLCGLEITRESGNMQLQNKMNTQERALGKHTDALVNSAAPSVYSKTIF